ncbi:Hypothetical predicted protein [Cloeon dipterum]|uniref:Uncharacterized protein n=1 Tax=Cloeon dipterum TaxID=197152 RepID=A0A8S1DBA3_9INSE|nr:Hypothetical predicted protein [Cloeon dipterum]
MWRCDRFEATCNLSSFHSGSGGQLEMSLQKVLCSICERPTADGAVLGVHVNKEKLQTWFLNVSGHELDEEVEDEDLICFFCLWHAEFLGKFNGISDEALVWWPRNSDYSDDAAKELRNYYFEGKLEQCWVQLEKIELPQSDGEGTQNAEAERCDRLVATCKHPSIYSGSGGPLEMSLQKELCLICERPTADGAVQAFHVDKEKLQAWFLNVSGHELAEEILDDDLICFFCLWHAEFLGKFNAISDEALVWWPRNSDYTDDAAKELRNYYFEGKLEQCWVQLEKIELPQSDGKGTQNSEAEQPEVDMNPENPHAAF